MIVLILIQVIGMWIKTNFFKKLDFKLIPNPFMCRVGIKINLIYFLKSKLDYREITSILFQMMCKNYRVQFISFKNLLKYNRVPIIQFENKLNIYLI